MYSAIGVEPTKPIARTRSSASSTSTASLSPCTTLRTPAGSPASRNSSAIRTGTEGSRSLGLSTKALPDAMAGPICHSGIIAGKLNGVIPATTPSGWRSEYTSMPVPTAVEYSPLSRCGAPMQNSITSTPRWMSPFASSRVLPCSRESSSARGSSSSRRSSRKRMNTRARFCGLVAAHAGCAASAFAIAARTSSPVARGTRACTAPVLGSKTSPKRPDAPSWRDPPTKWGMSRIIVLGPLTPPLASCR